MNAEVPVLTSSEQFERAIQLESIFMPEARRRRDKFCGNGQRTSARFVHYTSADAALGIIRSKRIWMRNTNCMTDFSEVQHGRVILGKLFADEGRKAQLYAALDTVSPNIAAEAVTLFDQWWNNIRFSTYIASISEHADEENAHGRLSMWRAFGNQTAARVALVLRVPWSTGAQDVLNVWFSPVAYLTEEVARAVFEEVTRNITANADFLKSLDRQLIVSTVFNMLVAGVTCMKHEGFIEEREWRAIYTPQLRPSPLMDSAVEVIGGIPQIVYKLPLDVRKSEALAELDMTGMFDRLIIGPSQFSWAMFEAFVGELKAIGVAQPESRICISGIPIRS